MWTSSEIDGPKRQQTYHRTCAPSENLYQSAHSSSLIKSSRGALWITKDVKKKYTDNEDSDQGTQADLSLRLAYISDGIAVKARLMTTFL